MKVDAKECIRNAGGRYFFLVDHHDKLVEERGMYWIALKTRKPYREPILANLKWVPAVCITYTDEMVGITNRTRDYEDKEYFRISWKQIWPELLPNGKNGRIP